MSEARDLYYSEVMSEERSIVFADMYITQLEQQKAELIEIAKEYSYLLLSQQSYDFNNEHDLKRGEEIETLLENIT